MAEPLAEAFAVLVEVVTEADIEAAATSALIDLTGEEIIGGGADLLIGTTGEGEVILEPIFEDAGAPLTPGNVLVPGELGNITKSQLHALWQDAKTFARWTGREIMKGALFEAGLETIKTALATNPPPGFELFDLKKTLGSVSASLKVLTQITTEWRRWCIKQFSKRNTFGMIRIENTLLVRFEIFRNKLGSLSTYMEKTLGPLLAQLNKSIDSANIGGLKAAMKTYADMILALSNGVKEKENLMMHAGLKDHKDEVQKFRDLLN